MMISVTKISPCCDKEKCFSKLNDFIGKLNFRDPLQNPNEVCGVKFEMNGHKNPFECSDTVMLHLDCISNELTLLKTGSRYEYLLTDQSNNQFEITIDEINTEEKYIKCNKYHNDLSKLKTGQLELRCILDYDKLPDMEKLNQYGFETLPTFHEARMEVIEREENYTHFRFSGGHPFITDVKIYGVLKEEINMDNDVDPNEYFTQDGCVGRVQFQTIDTGFIVKISDNYTSHELIGWRPNISFEKITELQKNPRNTKFEEHINEYFIYCSDIKFEFTKRESSD